MKTVLFLSGNTALWVRFKRHKLIDSFEEPITPASLGAYKPQRWLAAKSSNVHLLLDTELSEIDAHPLLETSSRLRYRSNKRALQQGLIKRFPDAIVQSAAKKAKLGAVLVQHINLSDDACEWLSAVQRSGVTVCSVTTVSELLAEYCATNCATHSYVVVSCSPEFTRHTFCQSGYALFTRVVESTNSKEQFGQTLRHLKASSLIADATSVFCIGVSENSIAQIAALTLVGKVISIDTKNKSDGLFFAGLVLASNTVRPNHAHRHVSYAMMPFHQRLKRKNQLYHVAALVVMVLGSLAYTLSNEWQRATKLKQISASQSELRQAIALYKDEALGLTPQSVVLSSALMDRVTVESAKGLSPAILLTVLAEAFTQFPELELQELSWAIVDSGSAASFTTKVTQVNLAGKINLGDSIRAQQSVFNAFTTYLQSQNELSNLTVLQTPLMQFDGGATVGSTHSKHAPRFALQFELNRLDRNDA